MGLFEKHDKQVESQVPMQNPVQKPGGIISKPQIPKQKQKEEEVHGGSRDFEVIDAEVHREEETVAMHGKPPEEKKEDEDHTDESSQQYEVV
mmetsp:Transcript_16629/g.14497  ORF Transcript_16629/g.14497 Transcript_16629/m.14497 type:complete len:92 (+) Transcript_16629:1294-1569(+)